MNGDGSEKGLEDKSPWKSGVGNNNQSSLQAQTSRKSETGKNSMESEGRGYSDLYRNTSEEIVLKSLIESSIGNTAPSMEMLGFKNISQTFRVDSEELFNSWLSNGEIPGYTSTSNIAHRTRQASRSLPAAFWGGSTQELSNSKLNYSRISTELTSLSSQQNGNVYQKKSINDDSLQQNLRIPDELSNDPNQLSLRNALEKGMQASNLYLAKAWFQSSQPMTRSRSSELRRRYASIQSFQIPPVMEAPLNMSGRVANRMEQDFAITSSFCDPSMGEILNQLQTFMSPSNSYTSPVHTPPVATVDSVSSVVSMLKGTLERKKLTNQPGKEMAEGSSFGFYGAHEVPAGLISDQDAVHQILEQPETFPALSSVQVRDLGNIRTEEGSLEIDMEGFVAPPNQIQMGAVSQEPSQSESSAAAPVLSTGLEVCDDPNHSGQTVSVCESSRRHVVGGNLENGSEAKGFREWSFKNNLKDAKKKGHLVRMASVSSGGSVDKGDPTKKRRVERSRKIAEAKERNSTPTIPLDMQSVLNRCENLEKEVRSLKLNLSFMNRKDSEQTKQIEELQKKNEELMDEKERLLEEIERIISDPGKM